MLFAENDRRSKGKSTIALFLVATMLALNALSGAGCKVRRPGGTIEATRLPTRTLDENETISSATLTTGEMVQFDKAGASYDPGSMSLKGKTEGGNAVQLRLDDISYVFITRETVDGKRTALLIAGVAVAAAAIAIAATRSDKEEAPKPPPSTSCPLVYSYDGERYVFEAEPLGGTITAGLQKADYSRLQKLRPLEGRYHIQVRNEQEETQYLDEVALLSIDHPAGTEVVSTALGTFHIVHQTLPPKSVFDEDGKDLKFFLNEREGLFWQSDLWREGAGSERKTRHELILTFPKPRRATTAKLLFRGGTSPWGSRMVRSMLELRGNQVETWYEAVDEFGSQLLQLAEFVEREELYILNVDVKEGQKWVSRGLLPGGGPLAHEDRVVSFDVSQVSGETLTLRLWPPVGFWAIDYLGVDYSDSGIAEPKVIALTEAVDQAHSDVAVRLQSRDGDYHVMLKMGDWVDISFDGSTPSAKGRRSLFLRTDGFYRIHLPKDQLEQSETITELASTPGLIVEFALDEFLKFRDSLNLKSVQFTPADEGFRMSRAEQN